jgi:hypothetical protein
MQKLKNLFQNAKREVVIGTGTALAVVGNSAFAAEGDIDITKALLYVAGGLVAAGAVGAAMFGLVTLIGASKKAQRAGT